ncbi:MAG: FtsB family cell division protein [Cyclonatronaceae bacterium]
MNPELLNPLRWKKSFLFTVLIGFLVVWFGFLDSYSVYTRISLEREKKHYIERTLELQQKTELLNLQIEALKNDPAYLEKIAREDYGMRKPNETVYRIQTK